MASLEALLIIYLGTACKMWHGSMSFSSIIFRYLDYCMYCMYLVLLNSLAAFTEELRRMHSLVVHVCVLMFACVCSI